MTSENMTHYAFGVFDPSPDGERKEWRQVTAGLFDSDAQAEAYASGLEDVTPLTVDGEERQGIHILRYDTYWFCAFKP